jgi:hypothetical protein
MPTVVAREDRREDECRTVVLQVVGSRYVRGEMDECDSMSRNVHDAIHIIAIHPEPK